MRDGGLDIGFAPLISLDDAASIYRIRMQDDGKLLVAGDFIVVQGTRKTGIARLNSDGTLDTAFLTYFNFGAVAYDFSIQPNGKIIVVGSFTQVNGQPANRVARLDADGSLDPTFDVGTGPNDIVGAIDRQADGKLIITGSFTSIDGITSGRIARLSADGQVDQSFGSNIDGIVRKIQAMPDGKIFIGGSFSRINGQIAPRLARLNPDGSIDQSFTPLTGYQNITVNGFYVQSDLKVLVAGWFQNLGTATGAIRVNSDGTPDASFVPPADLISSSTVFQRNDGKIILAGDFNTQSSDTRIVVLMPNGSPDSSPALHLARGSAPTQVLPTNDGTLLIAGRILKVDSFRTDDLIRVDSSMNVDEGFQQHFAGSGANFGVITHAPGGKLIIAGRFDRINGFFTDRIGRINSSGEVDTSFSVGSVTLGPPAEYENPSKIDAAVVQPDGKVIIGGPFGKINGVLCANVARLNSDGSLDTQFSVGTGPGNGPMPIKTFALQANGQILVAGPFSQFDGHDIGELVRLESNGTVDTTFHPVIGAQFGYPNVSSVILDSSQNIYIGGKFQNINGTPTSTVARLDPTGALDPTFSPPMPTSPGGTNVIAFQSDGKLLVGGPSHFDDILERQVYRLNLDGTLDNTFHSGKFSGNGSVEVILPLSNGRIFISGGFYWINDLDRHRVARLTMSGAADYAFRSPTMVEQDDLVRAMVLGEDEEPIIFGDFDKVNGVPRTGIAKLNVSGGFRQPVVDFDGDGRTDATVFRPSSGIWYRIESQYGITNALKFGSPGDRPSPADFDGDAVSDVAVFRNGIWYILNSGDQSVRIERFGIANDVPVAADYDGDGLADIAVFRPSSGVWYINQSVNGFIALQFGQSGDRPVIGDFNGDGHGDLIIFRPNTGVWYSLSLQDWSVRISQFGMAGDVPVSGDFDADGKTDMAVWRPSSGVWYILKSLEGLSIVPFGSNGDIPIAGDYDGDGRSDISIWRPNGGIWYIAKTSGGVSIFHFGLSGDIPLPLSYP